jgi:hypothetical protein
MLPFDKKVEQFSRELDRYLFIEPNKPQAISPEDQPDLELGVQLIQADFSQQSGVRSSLRHHLEKERGIRSTNPTLRLMHFAASSRQGSPFRILKFWPALFVLVMIVNLWSWTSTVPVPDSSTSRQAPIVAVTAVLSSSPLTVEPDPIPVPTPIAPASTGAFYPHDTAPAAQHTPLGLLMTHPGVPNP